MFCFGIKGKRSNRSPKRNLQMVRKKNGEIKITRVKRPRSGPRQTPRPHSPSDVEAQPPERIVSRSPPPDPQVVSGQVQEEVIERQQQQTRVPAPQATAHWTPDEDTTLTELNRDGLHIQNTAEAMGRAVDDVLQRWAQIEVENREAERRGREERRRRERQRARDELQNRSRPTNPPVTNQAPPTAHAAVMDRTVESVTQRLADIEVQYSEAERRGREERRLRERQRAREDFQQNRYWPRNPPAAHAAVLDRTVENVPQRLAHIEDEDREAERRGRERQMFREESWPEVEFRIREAERSRRERQTDREIFLARSRQRQEELQNRRHTRNPPEPNQAPPAAHAAELDRTVENATQRLAQIESEDREAERRDRERQRVRGELWADIEVQNREAERRRRERQTARENLLAEIENESREVERMSRERQRARAELQNRCLPTDPLVTNRAPPTHIHPPPLNSVIPHQAPAAAPDRVVENVAPGSVNIEDKRQETNWTFRERQRARDEFRNLDWPTNRPETNQAPLASHVAQQQRGRSMRPSSRRPADRNAIAVDSAPEPIPATVRRERERPDSRRPADRNATALPERERPPQASYRFRDWSSGRRGFGTDSTSIRLRPTDRYRSHSPQYHRERRLSTDEQRNRPAVAPAPTQEPVGSPGNIRPPGPSRLSRRRFVWTLGANGWESLQI